MIKMKIGYKANQKKVIHKAKALSPKEVEANRSSAYKYMNL